MPSDILPNYWEARVMKITQHYADTIELPHGRAELLVFDEEIPGFGLRIGKKRKSWVVQWQVGTSQRRMTVGHTGILSATKARDTAKTMLAKVRLGDDPQSAKFARRHAALTGELLPEFLEQKRTKGRSAGTLKEMERYLLGYSRSLHGIPVKAVSRSTISNLLDKLAAARSPLVADACRRYLSSFFGWAMRNGHADINPVMLTERPAEPSIRERLLRPEEIRAIWQATGDGSDFSNIVRLLMLTGQRRLEIAGLSWSEIDLAKGILRLPSSRVKNKTAHMVHLSSPARSILESVPRRQGYDNLFGAGPRSFSGFSKAKTALDKRIATLTGEAPDDWRLHDLRRYADTTMRELGVNPWVVEAILNHLPQGVSRHYNFAQLDEARREALERLAQQISDVLSADTEQLRSD